MFVGAGSGIDFPRPLDTETDPAVRDSACPTRHDDPRTHWSRKDQVYPHADEGYDRLWRTPQGAQDEPQGHQRPPDVWSTRCGHQWLDWRNLLHSVEKDPQN